MTRKFFSAITIIVFILTALGISALVWFPREASNPQVKKPQRQTQVITPQRLVAERIIPEDIEMEPVAYEERITAKVGLDTGEILVSLITDNFDEDPEE